MDVRVLGPLSLDGADGLAPRDRVVLEALVVRRDETVDKDVLADALYGENPPPSWPKVVQGSVGRIRKALGSGAIETTPYGYRLQVHDDELDVSRFEHLLARARDHLRDNDPDRASFVLHEALGLWRGGALPDLQEWPPGRSEAARLDGLRMDAQELFVGAEIAAGRVAGCLDRARQLVTEAPFREHRWCLLARTMYHTGRQTESLETLRRARRMLLDEMGLDPGPELLDLEQAILRHDPALSPPPIVRASNVCPYRGLLAYEVEDTDSFFGRDVDVARCLQLLRENGVLAVVGPSGSGKSSVVRAGVVATLLGEGVDVLITTPGARPVDSLGDVPTHGRPPVLVVDQAEEAVTLCQDPAERVSYFARLEEYDGPLVVALRADRLGDLSAHPAFVRVLERGLYLLTAMGTGDLQAVINGPAEHAGLRLEPGLTDLLVREVAGQPGALPLLSHVLRQSWQFREGNTLTVEGYHRTGGIRDALARSAERVYELLDDPQRERCRALFMRLVVPGDDGEAARTRVPRDNLAVDPSQTRLVDTLIDARLLSSTDRDVQIAHEALTREWPRLQGWLAEDVEGQRTFHHLTVAAESWEAMGRPESELYRGVRLAAAAEWADRHASDLTSREQIFIEASRANAERELQARARSNRRLRLALGGVAALLACALLAGFLALAAQRRAQREAATADSAAVVADARRLAAQALVATEPDVSLLLGLESAHLDDSLASRSTLYDVLAKASRLFAVARPRGGALESVDLSPDGRTVAVTSSMQGELATYDAATLAKTASRDDLGGFGLQYSPDGRSLAVSVLEVDKGQNPVVGPKPLQVLDASSLDPRGEFLGVKAGNFVEKMDYSADGTRFAAVEWSPETNTPTRALVWDVSHPGSPILRVPMPGLNGSVELSRDGRVLYLTQRIRPIRAIEVSTGRELASRHVDSGGERGVALALSDDGRTVANASIHGIELRDSGDLRLLTTLAGASDGVSELEFSSDGKQLAAGYSDGNTIVWDLGTPRPTYTLRAHTQEVWDATFSRDGGSLYTVARDGQLLGWDLAGTRGFPPWRSYPTNPHVDNPYRAFPSPDGTSIAYLGYGAPEGRAGAQLLFRDVASGRLTARRYLPFYSEPIVSWSPDSHRLLTMGGWETLPSRGLTHIHNLQTWDPSTGTLIKQHLDTKYIFAKFTAQGDIVAMSAPPNGQAGQDAIATLDPETLEANGPTVAFAHEDVEFFPLEVSSGRTALIGRGAEGGGRLIDLVTGTSSALPKDFPAAWDAAFSPDGDKLAVFGYDREWGVLDARSLGEAELRWLVPRRPYKGIEVWNVFWSGDGAQLFTSGNGSVELWDAATLTHLGSLSAGAKDNIARVQPLPDGHSVMMAHPQGGVLTWDLRPGHLVDIACSLAGRNLTPSEWKTFVGTRTYHRTCPEEQVHSRP